MKKMIAIVWAISIMVAVSLLHAESSAMRWYDVNARSELSDQQVIDRLKDNSIILVGEQHDSEKHHQAQLQVIRTLYGAGSPLAIGMEMFRHDSQRQLDEWVADKIDEHAFQEVFRDNWGSLWPLYRPILLYARENHIPLVGLNVDRDITSQVARKGFASLSDEQKGHLSDVACTISEPYMDFIKEAYGAHAHGDMNFTWFCEAQLVWDTAMAAHALNYLKEHPDRRMVILAGSGHARKMGIPEQIKKRSSVPYTVVLPEEPGVVDTQTITTEDADLLIIE